jgi:hypothetical protein
MLKRLDPFLGPQRLAALRSARQGKRIVRVDARVRASVPVTLLDEVSAVRALNAALSLNASRGARTLRVLQIHAQSFCSGCHGRNATLPQRSHQEGRHSS